jgi:hypothetical protein
LNQQQIRKTATAQITVIFFIASRSLSRCCFGPERHLGLIHHAAEVGPVRIDHGAAQLLLEEPCGFVGDDCRYRKELGLRTPEGRERWPPLGAM